MIFIPHAGYSQRTETNFCIKRNFLVQVKHMYKLSIGLLVKCYDVRRLFSFWENMQQRNQRKGNRLLFDHWSSLCLPLVSFSFNLGHLDQKLF